MSLIFEEDLSGGDAGNFLTETGGVVLGSGITYTGSAANLTIPQTDLETALLVTDSIVTSTPQIHVKFDFTLDSFAFGASKLLAIFAIRDASQQVVFLRLFDNSGDGNVDSLRVEYQRNGTNYLEIFPIKATLADGVYSSFEIFFQEQYSTADNGRIKISIGGELVCNVTLSDQHIARNYCDTVVFGNYAAGASTIAATRELSLKNILVSPSSAFDSGVSNYYVDNVNGDDGNTGTVLSPLKNAGNVMKTILAGDTLTLVNNGEANPHRLMAGNNGVATVLTAGTASALVTVTSDTGKAPITTSHGVGSGENYQWNASGSNGEYYVSLTGGGDPSILTPSFIALGKAGQAFDELRRVFADGNTAGSLAEGEFAFGDNDTLGYNVVYYKPLSTETIATLRAEINRNSIAIEFSTDYTIVKNIKPRMCGTGVRDSGSSTGSEILDCDAGYCRTYGIQSDGGACLIQGNESHNNQSHVLGSGSEVGGGITNTGGSTSITQGNHCHDNADDGMDVEGVGTNPDIIGNRLINNGYNSSDGTGLEVAGNIASGTLNICNNETSGNSNRGISLAIELSTHTTLYVLKNNNIHDEDSTGLWLGGGAVPPEFVVATHLSASNNNFYNNPTDVNDTAATGSYSSTGDIAVDGDLDNGGIPNEGSALIGAGVKWWGTDPRPVGSNGEPYPDVNIDIGGAQSRHSIGHPVNL